MMELLWLLLPVAAASGWWAAKQELIARRHRCDNRIDYVKGLNYLLDDKHDQAVEVFVRMSEVDQSAAETHLALGNLFRRRGEVDRAISIHRNLFAKAGLSFEQRGRAMLELGEDYMRAGLFDRAESLFKEIIGQYGHTAVALARLVNIYEQEKDWRQAISYSDRLEQLTDQCRKVEVAQYYCELAEEAQSTGDKEAGRKYLQQALERDPDCVRASILQGHMSMQEGDYEGAIIAFCAVGRQNQSFFPEVIIPLNQCCIALGQENRLIECLRKIQEKDHSGRITVSLVELLRRHQGEDAALAFLEAELRHYPTVLGMRTLIDLKLGQLNSANHSDLEALYRIGQHLLSGTACCKCDSCGFIGKSLHWRCPSCKRWSSVKPLSDLIVNAHD